MLEEKVDSEISDMLLQGEQILFVASRSRVAPGGSLYPPDRVYITNTRLLFKHQKFLGLKANISDIGYRHISVIRLKRGIFTTEIRLMSRFSSEWIKLQAVDKEIAKKISVLIQKGMAGAKDEPATTMQQHNDSEKEKALGPDVGRGAGIPSLINGLQKDAGMEAISLNKISQKMPDGEAQSNIATSNVELQQVPDAEILKENSDGKDASTVAKDNSPSGMSNVIESEDSNGAVILQQPTKIEKAPCRFCNADEVPPNSIFCPMCGENLQVTENIWKVCPQCDAIEPQDACFCTRCRREFKNDF